MNAFDPKLISTNWNDEWMQLQRTRRAFDDSSYWDNRAKKWPSNSKRSSYGSKFIELMGMEDGMSVLDMGCGSGTLSIPLSKRASKVLAADFSKGMLMLLEEDIKKEGISNIETMQLSWQDDWRERGIAEGAFDIAIASRSIATSDLRAALEKLSYSASRKCCITLSAGFSPRSDVRILRAIGIDNHAGYDFIYAFNILTQMGYLPSISYISSERHDTYSSMEEAYENLSLMVSDALQGEDEHSHAEKKALDRLYDWLQTNLVPNSHAGEPEGNGMYQKEFVLRHPRKVVWAFISWDKDDKL